MVCAGGEGAAGGEEDGGGAEGGGEAAPPRQGRRQARQARAGEARRQAQRAAAHTVVVAYSSQAIAVAVHPYRGELKCRRQPFISHVLRHAIAALILKVLIPRYGLFFPEGCGTIPGTSHASNLDGNFDATRGRGRETCSSVTDVAGRSFSRTIASCSVCNAACVSCSVREYSESSVRSAHLLRRLLE
eukprot:1178972-Prorocentrum_minimum.AAC.3